MMDKFFKKWYFKNGEEYWKYSYYNEAFRNELDSNIR